MVYRPRGTPGCLPASTPWFTKFLFAVIVAIATTLSPIGWPNIDNVTCLLTPSVALPGSQYQETDKPLQGGRRRWKIPHRHHHNQFTSHHLYCPPRRRRRKRKTLALYLQMAKFLSRSHENLLRYISYRAVLPFAQLQVVPLGNTPSPDTPRYRLDCPSHRQHQKRKTLALYFPMANFLSRLHENLLRYISYRALLPFTQLNAITRNWIDGLHLLLLYVKGCIIFQCCNEKNDADYDRHVIHLPHTCHEDGLNHLVLDVEGCVVNLNVTEASASYAGVLIDREGSMKWRRRKKRKLVIFLYFLCNINHSQRCGTFFAMSLVSPMTTFPNSG